MAGERLSMSAVWSPISVEGFIREHSRVLETQEWVQVLALTRLYLTGLSKEKKIYRLDLETKANADTEVNG